MSFFRRVLDDLDRRLRPSVPTSPAACPPCPPCSPRGESVQEQAAGRFEKEGLPDYVSQGWARELIAADPRFKRLAARYLVAYRRLTAVVKRGRGEDFDLVREAVDREGFDYCFTRYSRFAHIKDPSFRKAVRDYVAASGGVSNYFLGRRGGR